MNYAQIADTLRREAVRTQHLLDGAAAFDQLAQADSLLAALASKRDALTKEITKAQADLDTAKKDEANAKAKAAKHADESDLDVEQKHKDADLEIAAKKQKAIDTMTQEVEAKRQEKLGAIITLETQIANAMKAVKELEAQRVVSDAKAQDANDRATKAQARLDKITQQINDLAKGANA